MFVRILFPVAIIVLVSPVLAVTPYDVPFELHFGDSVAVGPDGLVVGFEEMVQDSRCPADVTCVWAGDAEAALFAEYPTIGVDRFSLHTHRDFDQEIQKDIWLITLLQVSPYPQLANVPIDPDDYRVKLVVSVQSILGVESATWGSVKALYK